MVAMHPWIPALVTSSQQIKMDDDVSLSFYQVLITIITGIPCLYVPKSVPKLLLWVNTHNVQATRLQVTNCFQLLVSKMVDSQQWRISPNNGRLDFTRCRRFDFKVTYYCSNHLKLMLCIGETSLYEIIMSVIIKFLLFSHSSTPKLAKLLQGQQLFQ